jgi:hypothetical protein
VDKPLGAGAWQPRLLAVHGVSSSVIHLLLPALCPPGHDEGADADRAGCANWQVCPSA